MNPDPICFSLDRQEMARAFLTGLREDREENSGEDSDDSDNDKQFD